MLDVVLEARLVDALRQRDELLEAIDGLDGALAEGEDPWIDAATDDLFQVARKVREEVWGDGE